MAILDEIDSGLDIDALRDVAKAVNALKRPDSGVLMITHYKARAGGGRGDHALLGKDETVNGTGVLTNDHALQGKDSGEKGEVE